MPAGGRCPVPAVARPLTCGQAPGPAALSTGAAAPAAPAASPRRALGESSADCPGSEPQRGAHRAPRRADRHVAAFAQRRCRARPAPSRQPRRRPSQRTRRPARPARRPAAAGRPGFCCRARQASTHADGQAGAGQRRRRLDREAQADQRAGHGRRGQLAAGALACRPAWPVAGRPRARRELPSEKTARAPTAKTTAWLSTCAPATST